jgi:YfiH family protein
MTRSSASKGAFTSVREVTLADPDRLVHPAWAESFPWLVQGTTGRGTLDDPFDLGLFSGGLPEVRVRANWRDLGRALSVEVALHARQVHGADVLVHRPSAPARATRMVGDAVLWPMLTADCDGHVSAAPGALLAVTTADCVPVFLVDPERRAVAALHAGWRGAAAGVLERGLRALTAEYATDIEAVHVHFGPAICGSCYEVGPEVFAALDQPQPSGPTPIDLRRILAERAVAAGVVADRISISTHCTRCTGSGLFSHRAGDGHRQVGYIGVR